MRTKDRFDFGSNWESFLSIVDEERISGAERSLCSMLGDRALTGKSFLDAGCGSGLFSLAAMRMGARVSSFDLDSQCVACTNELRQRAFPDDPNWTVRQGSVLDEGLLASLDAADIVYSWGVLHHTGDMKKAIRLLAKKVNPGGIFFLSIYNDQGAPSRRWRSIKQLTNKLPHFLRWPLVLVIAFYFESRAALGRLLRGENPFPFPEWTRKKKERGMSAWHDWVDWCGGYPFEVAKPEDTITLLRALGFELENLKTCLDGWGCNEYVFRRAGAAIKE